MSELEYSTNDVEGVPGGLILRVTGSIDAVTAIPFQAALDNILGSGAKHILVDMDGVKFVNSTGMGLLVRIADSTTTAGGTFYLLQVHPKVKVVFSMLGLDAFFEMYSSVDAALAQLKTITGGTHAIAEEPAEVDAPASRAPRVPKRTGQTAIRARADVQQKSAFIGIPHSLQNFGLIYTHLQSACVGAGVVARRADPNLNDDAWKQALGDVTSVNFILADFSGDPATGQPNAHILQLADYVRTQLKPAKPVLSVMQGAKATLPPPWNQRPVIPYVPSPQGLQQLQKRVEDAIKRALPRL